ncbi:MAG: hypothetical protein JWO46_2502 [Nocardioidaceae bacterium]|nr:hypothetical protein [Nocardioidaceae bacterium]
MTRAATFLLALLLLVGCGQARTGPADGDDTTTIPVGKTEIPADAVVWAQGSTIHVDDRQVDVGGEVDRLAVARGGIYFSRGGQIWFTDLDRVERTGIDVFLEVHTSKDGRYLGAVEFDHGPEDQFGTKRAAVIVVDTTTGKTVLRDDTLMGDLKKDDLADLYEDAEPHVIGFNADNIYAQTAEGNDVLRYPLDGSKPENLGDQAEPAVDDPGGRLVGTTVHDGVVTVQDDPYQSDSQGQLSPSGRTVLVGAGNGRLRAFDTATGQPLALSLDQPGFVLGAWTGPDTFYGVATSKGYHPAGIFSCDRDQARCTEVVPASAMSRDPVLMPAGNQIGM